MTSEFDIRDEADLDIEAQRFADALLALEVGGTPRPTADPQLASMIRTVAFLRAGAQTATETAAYRSYRARSRAYVLHTLEQRAPASIEPVSVEPISIESMRTRAGDGGILLHIDRFLQRHRRLTFTTPVAAAAAAVALLLFGAPVAAPTGSEPRPAIAHNQTADDADIARIRFTLATIANRSANGQTVDAILLRTITETTSAVANRIDSAPQTISREHVANYQRTIATGNYVLSTAQPTAGSEDALAAAQLATQDGQVTAARFLAVDEAPTTTTPKPAADTAATPAPTSTPPATTVTPNR